MFETVGAPTIVEFTSSLAALVLLPLLWAAVAALAAVRGAGGRLATRAAIAASGGTLALAVAHAEWAAKSPPGHVAQQHLATLARVGQLDLALDLVRSPMSAACAVLAAFVGFVAVLHAVWSAPAGVSARLAWTGLATSAVILVALSDDLPTLAIGLQAATIAGWAVAGGRKLRVLVLALAGDLTIVFAAWILFWSLGGTFGPSGFAPDPLPRFAIVAVPPAGPSETSELEASPVDAKASVSLTTYEDAMVSSDDGPPLPGEPIRSPFNLVLPAGVYSFRIEAGAASTDMLVTHVTLAPGRAYVLMPFGPTTSLTNLEDQLAVPRPMAGGASSTRTALASRTLSGVRVTSVVGILVVLAALLRLALLGRRQEGGLAYALEAIPPVVIALQLLPLLDPGAGSTLAIASAVAAVVLAGDAASSGSADRVPPAALAALAALAITSVLVGETAGAMVILVAASLGVAAATAALDTEVDVRWLGVACASLAGVMPGAGTSPGVAAVLAGAFGASASGRQAGAVVAPLVAIAAILVAMATIRVYSAAIGASFVGHGARGSRMLAVILGTASLGGGAFLGVGTSPFGGRTAPFARRLVDAPGGLDGNLRIATAAFGLSLAAAAVGLVAARRATDTSNPPAWLALLGVPATLAARAAQLLSALVRFFVRSVAIMNRDVIDDATAVAASIAAALARALGRLDARVGTGLLARVLNRDAGKAAGAGIDDSARFQQVRAAAVLGMVVILALVVLSSLVLG